MRFPGSSPAPKIFGRGDGSRSRIDSAPSPQGEGALSPLLATTLDVARDELLGVFFEEIVDVVQERVQRFLQFFALLRQLRCSDTRFFFPLRGLSSSGVFLLLSHGHSPPCLPRGSQPFLATLPLP